MNRVSQTTETVTIDDEFAKNHFITPEHRREWGPTAQLSKAIYRSEDGSVYVKVHAVRLPLGFGEVGWRMTGSQCNAQGNALPIGQGRKIHTVPHLVKVASDSAEIVSDKFDAGLLLVAQRVFTAVAHEAFAPPTI